MIEIAVSKIVSLCLSCFAVGFSLSNVLWTFHVLDKTKDELASQELDDYGYDGHYQRKNRQDF